MYVQLMKIRCPCVTSVRLTVSDGSARDKINQTL